jgi:dTDP-glucose 4,6-dehydratase
MKVVITGGAGFIGSSLVELALERGFEIVTLDALTYAAEPSTLELFADHKRHRFVQADLRERHAVDVAIAEARPDAILHLAAESHVDRSIDRPCDFVKTNIVGTFNLLQAALGWWGSLDGITRTRFRFLHVSTDEVFGALGPTGAFNEETPYAPNSPYAASKASSDLLVRAWGQTYGMPTVTTNCSNNFGPRQFPEKLIPVVILNAMEGRPIPIYGAGQNVRDWLFVNDHAAGILAALEKGGPGETYVFGSGAEVRNIDLIRMICGAVDELLPNSPHMPHEQLITFVADRPGYDFRYAIDASKAKRALDWTPTVALADGLKATVEWYLNNSEWWGRIRARTDYDDPVQTRLGLGLDAAQKRG